MTATFPKNARGPIVELTLPASANAVDLILRNKTTGKQLTLNLPAAWSGDDLTLDFFNRTIRDQTDADRSALLNATDNELWIPNPLITGENDLEIEVLGLTVASETNLTLVAADDPRGVAVDGTYVYWAETTLGTIGRAKLDGTEVNKSWLAIPTAPTFLAVDGTYIYINHEEAGQRHIARAKLDGSGLNKTFIASIGLESRGVAVDGTFIYWAESSGQDIYRAKLDGTGKTKLVEETDNAVRALAVDGTFIYWTHTEGIGRALLDGSSPNLNFVTGVVSLPGLGVDTKNIYWSDATLNQVGVAFLDGSNPNLAWQAVSSLSGLAVSDTHVYWADPSLNRIGRAKKVGVAYAAVATLYFARGYY